MNNEPAAWLHIQGDYSEAWTRPLDDDEIERGWEQKPLYTHPAKTLTDEEIKVVCFALHKFINAAYDRAHAAGQDLRNTFFKVGDVEKFLKDAKTAESALAILRKATV